MEPKIIQMAALGRSLYPGMLYDCRSDSFIPGVTLWDKKALIDDLDVHDQTKTYVKLSASDNLSEKASQLNVSASLKASFLGGLVEIGGSAKYMNDTKTSTHQCRVTMQFSQTTKFEQLTMKEIGNITYPQVFEQKTATHVVTAVLYGASAFMVFDHTSEESDNQKVVEGSLHAVVRKIPSISIEGQASVKMTEDEKRLVDNINVTFYGDYELDENPTTYSEALKACKKMPSTLKERKSKGVPVTVWLYPLVLLDKRAASLARDISMSLVTRAENVFEDLGEVERRCNDLIKNSIASSFPRIKDRLIQFEELLADYKLSFQKALMNVLPAIRSGQLENKALGDILNVHQVSPFTATNMNKWLDNITAEIYILRSYTNGLKGLAGVTSPETLKSTLYDPDIDAAVCLSFTSLHDEDLYLKAIDDFLQTEGFTNLDQKTPTLFLAEPWFSSHDISENLSLFTNFAQANKSEKKIKSIIASISDPKNPGCSIQLYKKGLLKSSKFQPVSKPPLPAVEASDGNVKLKLSESPTGETVKFRIEYRMTPPPAVEDNAWVVTQTADAQANFTLSGLRPADQYWLRYRVVGNVGVSEASDSVAFTLRGKLDVRVDQWDFTISSLFNKLRNKILTNVGMSRWSLTTVNSEVKKIINSPRIPYKDTIPEGLKPGMALYFQGVVLATGKYFEINFLPGTKESSDVIFCMYCNAGDSVSYNSFRNGKWENADNKVGALITKGSSFDIFILAKTEGYEVYVNGQKCHMFKHRMPMANVAKLSVAGDIIMNVIGTVPNWNSSTFGTEMTTGISRTKFSNIQDDVAQAVCNPKKLYYGKLLEVLRPGVALFFQGVFPSDGESFEICLMTGPKYGYDIAFQFKSSISSVALNSCKNGTWEKLEKTPGSPFLKGGAFDMFMIVKPEVYEIMVNGLAFCTFNHRVPLDSVKSIYISGDVFMNNFGIIEVARVDTKVTIPANI